MLLSLALVSLILSCSFSEIYAPSSWVSHVYILPRQQMWDDSIFLSLGWLLDLDFFTLATRILGWSLAIVTFSLAGPPRKIPSLLGHAIRDLCF